MTIVTEMALKIPGSKLSLKALNMPGYTGDLWLRDSGKFDLFLLKQATAEL